MVARGHGLETLCLCLAIAQTALLDFIVALGLPTPCDRPHRRGGGRNPWLPQDVSVFIELWTEGWAAASLAERFGRSRSGIWSKARQLGLSRRERRAQFRPADPHAPVSLGPLTPSTSSQSSGAARSTRPSEMQPKPSLATFPLVPSAKSSIDIPQALTPRPVAEQTFGEAVGNTIEAPTANAALAPVEPPPSIPARPKPTQALLLGMETLPVAARPGSASPTSASLGKFAGMPGLVRKGARQEVDWWNNPYYDEQLSLRCFAYQHYAAAAGEMGVSTYAFLSRRKRLEIPRLVRGETVEEFNPEWAETTIKALRFKKVQCRAYKARGVEFYFWCKEKEARWFSQLAQSKAWFKEAIAGVEHGF